MVNERLKADAAMMMEELTAQLTGIAKIQRERARLTATVTACDKRITVTVNADGILVETRFSDDIDDLTYDEIAAAMTEAVQAAAADAARLGRELMDPLRERKARLPRLSEMIEGAPDLGSMMPVTPPASTAPPNSPERLQAHDTTEADGAYRFPARRSLVSDQDR
ncbi:YbaB/EbfC family nucleoid-associated protein [Nocardia sp. CDC141]|uniref:YbaB/EbfC family nucleoid-associated protein n=2 Tax=Nocardia pulmonis TaxID=2951408 RepID=A0A9X2IY57_9NOCA|nr:YbaB/EbfC family nucleoid-associated protein [Nocardia sp. CDC159]MCM6776078.1 YbaB/EbfC family nucleoid-associated protein [Nocardia pulmonis]